MEDIRRRCNTMVDLSKFTHNKKWIKFSYKINCNLQLYLINIITYFENLTVELHVLYALNTHVKFCVNQILFTI